VFPLFICGAAYTLVNTKEVLAMKDEWDESDFQDEFELIGKMREDGMITAEEARYLQSSF
jgi:hypothetical protein